MMPHATEQERAYTSRGLRGTRARVAEFAILGLGARAIAAKIGKNHSLVSRYLREKEVRAVIDAGLSDVIDDAVRLARAHAFSVVQKEVEIALGLKKGDAAQMAAIKGIRSIAGIRDAPQQVEHSVVPEEPASSLPDLTTPEGEEQLVGQLRSLPRHILARAMGAA